MDKQSKKIKVIKLGGAILDEEQQLSKLLKSLQQYIYDTNDAVVIVHGGGCVVDELLTKLHLPIQKIDGLRVTPKEQIDIIVGALAGIANKKIVAIANYLGLKPVGISLADGNISKADILDPKLGMVGKPIPQQQELLQLLLVENYLPIISSIGVTDTGALVNINADEAAMIIAFLLQAELYLLSDIDGVYAAGKLLTSLNRAEIEKLIAAAEITGGMIVKVNTALQASAYLNQVVTIASWRNVEQLPALLQGNKGLGTKILADA